MNKISKIVIALNLVFGLAFVATVIYADSISLFFTTGISLLLFGKLDDAFNFTLNEAVST